MTYESQIVTFGKRPITILECDRDACALRYNSSATNLISRSFHLDNAAWTKSGCSVTANQTRAPDGTAQADLIIEDNANSAHEINRTQTVVAGSVVFSAYMKRYTRDRGGLILENGTDGSFQAIFDLKNGKIISTSGVVTADMEYIGDDWWRCWLIATVTVTSNNFHIYTIESTSFTYTGDGASGIYAWGAQVENASSLGHYVSTEASGSITKTCAATLSAGSECYNTRSTCQDTANYTKEIRTDRFCQPRTGLPIAPRLFPVLEENVEYTPTQIQPDKGLSLRSVVDLTIRDFAHHDRGIDPYVDNRANAPQGTFMSRWLARNPYYIGRFIRVRQGFVTDPWDWDNFQTRLFVYDAISGPKTTTDGNSTWRVTGMDLLKLGDNGRVKVPAPSDGKLSASLASGHTTSFTLDSDATLANYPTGGGTVAVGKEILSYASRSSYTCSTLTRGLYGTEDLAHNADETVQVCAAFNTNIVNMIHSILTDYVGIDGDTFIPYDAGRTTPTGTNDEWDDEEDDWLPVTINTIIPKPLDALKVLDALCRENLIDLWWDDEAQKIKLKANTPPLGNASVTQLTESGSIVRGSLKVIDRPDMRISRVITYYDKINLADDDKEANFERTDIYINPDLESADTYNEQRSREIKSTFFTGSNSSNVSQMQQRLVSRFGNTPKLLEFDLDARYAQLSVGNLTDITTRHIPGTDGAPLTLRYQIIYKKEKQNGHRYTFKALTFSFIQRNAFIGPNTLNDYSVESDANKDAYAFVGPNTGKFSDDGSLYLII